jgi:tRNA-Thr(GGU) m(6)t(6)A37 methyltransferase TsaA
MSMMEFVEIGKIHSEFKTLNNMPIQPTGEKSLKGEIVINEEYAEGLKDLEEFSHLIIIYFFHEVKEHKLIVKPFMDDAKRGVFSTRAPVRPNPIGLSVVEIEKIKGNIIYIKNIDVLDQTPVLDIKPLVPDFDFPKGEIKVGWLENRSKGVKEKESDHRFVQKKEGNLNK